MPKTKRKDASEFTADSTRFCDVCDDDIKIGFGGEANWRQHLESKKHQAAAKSPRKPKKPSTPAVVTTLHAFFKKSTKTPTQPSSSIAKVPPQPRLGTCTSPLKLDAEPEVKVASSATLNPHVAASEAADSSNFHPRILSLRAAAACLSAAVPEAVLHDEIATFSGALISEISSLADTEDPWEYVDHKLNVFAGWDRSIKDIASVLRRGSLGIDGLVRWLSSCIVDLKIDPILLEGKIGRIEEAIASRTASPAETLARPPSSLLPCNPTATDDLGDPLHSWPPEFDDLQDGNEVSSLDASGSVRMPDGSAPTCALEIVASPSSHSLLTKAAPPANVVAVSCPGYKLDFGLDSDKLPSLYYPWAIHAYLAVPYKVSILDDVLYLRSKDCIRVSPGSDANGQLRPCSWCRNLRHESTVQGMRFRALDGALEKTPNQFLAMSHMLDKLGRQATQLEVLRRAGLNEGRKLARRIQQLDHWKRLIFAVSDGHIPRIHAVLKAAHNNGSGVHTMLEMVDNAARHVYRARQYEEQDFQRSYLLWKLGGVAAAQIAHRTLGLPSTDATRRHIMTHPIRPSLKFPSVQEARTTLSHAFSGRKQVASAGTMGVSMSVDEIKIQERLRWDPRTNMIHGSCREDNGECDLEFRTASQATNLVSCVRTGTVHLASEATVIAISVLGPEPSDYSARPFIVSGTCKRERMEKHRELLSNAITAIREETQAPALRLRLYCVATDGESRRRRSIIGITFRHRLSSTSPLYSTLSRLSLFNIICGADELTNDCDFRHAAKRCRNTLIRTKSVKIDGVPITPAILRSHLMKAGMLSVTADALLSPNDKQDCILMYRLLNAITKLPDADPSDTPAARSSRRVLQLLGRLYHHLLSPYMNVTLSLHQQLAELSAAGHIMLALYTREKGDFMPVQLYFDLMSMIKNAYFCVAKAQHDNPTGEFHLILLGTDMLEKIFGKVRTMVGSDTNADIFQLGNRIDACVECVKILEEHPDWGGQARRLALKPLDEVATADIGHEYDHITPRSWDGDVHVRGVDLPSAWQAGRQMADGALSRAGIPSPFKEMEAADGFDMFCPFGSHRVVLVDGIISDGEREEDEDEMDLPPAPAENTQAREDTPSSNDVPAFEDTAAYEAARSDQDCPKYSAFVPIDPGKPQGPEKHKATILRVLIDTMTEVEADSTDRLKRVVGYSRYQHDREDPAILFDLGEMHDSTAVLAVEDPVATIIRSDSHVFVAIAQVMCIYVGTKEVDVVPVTHVHEPNVSLRLHVMILVPREISGDGSSAGKSDWEWNRKFDSHTILRAVPSRLIEPINPDLQQDGSGNETYTFETSDLRAVGSLIFGNARDILHRIPTIASSAAFPYRTSDGEACFICETETSPRDGLETSGSYCPRCSGVDLKALSNPAHVRHLAAHILHDRYYDGAEDLCGFCLQIGSACKIYIKTKSKGRTVIDMARSECPNLVKFSLGPATKSTKKSPCTNRPMPCPLCPKDSPAVWKYNLQSHIVSNHPTANVELYKNLHEISKDERVLMRKYLELPKAARKSVKPARPYRLSEAHSTRVALRATDREDATSDEESAVSSAYISSDDDNAVLESEDGETDEELEQEGNTPSEMSTKSLQLSTEHAPSLPTSSSNESTEAGASIPKLPQRASNGISVADPSSPAPCTATQPAPTGGIGSPELPPTEENISRRPQRHAAKRVLTEASTTCTTCGEPYTAETMLRCDGPACDAVFHYECCRFLERPDGDWFCDEICRENSMGRRGGRKRVRRV